MMAEPTIIVKSTTGSNVSIALDDGSATASVTPTGTALLKEFLVCAAFRQALLEHKVELDTTQTLSAEQLVMGRVVIKALLGTLQHPILGLHNATTTATIVLDERKLAFNDKRSETVQLLTQSQQLGPGANHLHASAVWLLEPTAESAELTVIDQQIAAKKTEIVNLDTASAGQLDTLLAQLAALEAQREAILHELLLHPAQQQWLQLQVTLTALKNAATAMTAADPNSVPPAIP
jgi:hypothetical protein